MRKRLSKLLFITIGGLTISGSLHAQLILNQPNTSGAFTAPQSITLSPGFSTTPGQTFSAIITQGCTPLATSLSNNQNYIATYTPRVAGITNPDDPNNTTCQVMAEVQYFDGLGRISQSVQVKASPGLRDVVQSFTYDPFGRETTKYLPYVVLPSAASNGSFQTNAITDQGSFYNNPSNASTWNAQGVASTLFPTAETSFEPSPLNRIVEQGAAGDNWQLTGKTGTTNSGHTVKTFYASNDATGINTGTGYWAKQFGVTIDNSGVRTLVNQGSYGQNQLYVTIIKDENWQSSDGKAGTVEEYRDKEGRTVLKRTFTSTEIFSTYYIFDDFGNLCYILPPKSEADTQELTQTILDNLCFQYRYDGRSRLIEKKIPGKGKEYMVYNKIDQVTFSQDANQLDKGQWLFNKYDGLGRIIMTGVLSSANGRADWQTSVDAQTVLWETRDNSNSNGTGYTSNSLPLNTAVSQYYSMNYFDDYNIPNLPAAYNFTSGSAMTKSLLTAKRVNVLGSSNMLWTVNYYDDYGRPITVFKEHYLGGALTAGNYNVDTHTYDFTGQLLSSTTSHKVANSEILNVQKDYTYDHIGRKKRIREKINNASQWTVLVENDYNELGQLKTKNLHSDESQQNYLQNIAYTYNERGWLTTANSSKLNVDLRYNTPNAGTTAQFNGNISQILYAGEKSGSKGFQYNYDKLNRLTYAQSTGNLLDESLIYDKMGNITQLTRGGYGTLQYTIPSNSNQLNSISGFVSGSYSYDSNGNTRTDGTKGITISYNNLNLVDQVTGSASATYIYDATGTKLRSVLSSAGVTTDYIDDIQYKNGQLAFVDNEEGRAVRNTGNGLYAYEYNLKDHLGNVRVSIDKDPNTQQARVIQEDEFYSYGLRKPLYDNASNNKKLFQGQELQDGLGLYQFKWRMDDPVIGRFLSIDPLAEKYVTNSTYAFSENKVTSHVEVEGLEAENFMSKFTKTENLPIKNISNGYGDVQKQHYRIVVSNSSQSFDQFSNTFQSNPESILTNSKATFEPVKDNKGNFSLTKGANIDIDINSPSGSMTNSSVRVLKADFSDKNFSVSFGTLKGHIEAGSINFSASEKDGKITFDITGTTRISHGAGKLLQSGSMRSNQKASWGEVLENVANFLGGKTEKEESTSVTYQYDPNKTDGKGKVKKTEKEDLKN